MLSCSAALLEAALVTGFEIDPDALNIFSQNVEDLELSNIEGICCDIFSAYSDRYDQFNYKIFFKTFNNSICFQVFENV